LPNAAGDGVTGWYRYYTLDVFTQDLFGGNPLAVFPEASGMSDAAMRAIARELNLSETVFVLPPERPEHTRRVRIFTPGGELPFAGHPTVGAGHLLAELGAAPFQDGVARLVLGEGVGPVEVTVRQGPPAFAELSVVKLPERGPEPPARADLARALSLAPDDLAGGEDAPEIWSCGVPFLFVAVRDRSVLARARVDTGVADRVLASSEATGTFVFCRDPERAGSDLRARMFAPRFGVPEDPATGAAAAALGGYLGARTDARDGTFRRVIEQGFEMGRPSLIRLTVERAAGRVTAVRVGGHAVRVSEGRMSVPTAAPAATAA
jgi:trans-2,3-dihydro-3-hydroxyanthranilate isomerase